MTFRPSRRQVLSSLGLSMAAGLAFPLETAFARERSQALTSSLQLANFNPATDIHPLSSTRQNTYPIVLVHGLAGAVHIGPFKYWGGMRDIPAYLNNSGFTTYAPGIGPFSSNWDRACELFAEIKGGQVDYGLAHSSKYGHARYGRTFPGMYPQWGQANSQTGQIDKIHLLTHSMGGQTARQLIQLLAQGSAEERVITPSSQLSPLFVGGKTSWVDSILTISSPNNGSSAVYEIASVLPFLPQFIAFLSAFVGDNQFFGYDFMLDQWGLARQPGESWYAYTNRIENSGLAVSRDNAEWDLNPDGASVLNASVTAQSGIYYFSVGTLDTYKNLFNQHQLPDLGMNALFVPFSIYIGEYTQNSAGHVNIDRSWWPNDGIVSTNSMAGPTVNSTDIIMPYNGTPTTGKWNYFNAMNYYSHLDIVGWGPIDMRPWFRSLAAFLASLPL